MVQRLTVKQHIVFRVRLGAAARPTSNLLEQLLWLRYQEDASALASAFRLHDISLFELLTAASRDHLIGIQGKFLEVVWQ